MEQCFVVDVSVRDERQAFEGLAAIPRWKAQTKEKYQHIVKPLAYVPTQTGRVVTMALGEVSRQPD